jgi:hypothetical protein
MRDRDVGAFRLVRTGDVTRRSAPFHVIRAWRAHCNAHPMTFRSLLLLALVTAFTAVGCGGSPPPQSTTTTTTTTTSETDDGENATATVRETQTVNADGTVTTERREDSREVDPAYDAGPQR